MGILDGLSGHEGMVAWISRATLWPAYAKPITPKELKTLDTVVAGVVCK